MTKNKYTIETQGDFSPGIVRGNYVVNQTIVRQYQNAGKKRWRKLDALVYPPADDSMETRSRYVGQLVYHLHKTFQQTGYIDFTSLAWLDTREVESQNVVCYHLHCQHPQFTGAARQTWKYLWNESESKKERKQYQDEMNDTITFLFEKWTSDIKWIPQDRLFPVQFVYDPDGGRIYIGPPQTVSTNLSEYPSQLRSTSELLSFLAAIKNSPIGLFDLDIANSYYPLQKLIMTILDNKSCKIDNIRINDVDREEWDYLNPQWDAEIKSYLDQRDHRS